ncbi:unnamed protein product, partial [marine sediment metagenome]
NNIPIQNARPIAGDLALVCFACSMIRITISGNTGQTQGIIFSERPAKNAKARANHTDKLPH